MADSSPASEPVVQPREPAAPPAQAPAGPDPFAQMMQQLEAELRSSEARRGQELKEARDAGEEVAALEKSHKRETELEKKNVELAKAYLAQEQILRQVTIAEIDREIKAQAKQFRLDETSVREDFLKTPGSPSDLQRVIQQHRLDKFEAGQGKEEEPEKYDSAQTSHRQGPNIETLSPEEKIKYFFDKRFRVK